MGIKNVPAPADARKLARYEDAIEKGLNCFLDVGKALLAIKDEKLYRWTHETFVDYCNERWNISKTTAYRRIDKAKPDVKIGNKCPTVGQTQPNLTNVKIGNKCPTVGQTQPSRMQTPQATKKPAVMKDARGVAIPARLQPCFNDAQHAIRSLVKRLGIFHKEIEEVAAGTEGCSLIPMSIITVSIKDCQAALNAAAPTWVCKCNGRGCEACDQRGWLQKHCGVVLEAKE